MALGQGSCHRAYPTTRSRILVAVSLAALLMGAVAVDRGAADRVEGRTVQAFQEGMGTSERPAVHVTGLPVLTQLAEGTPRHVDITAHDPPAQGTIRSLPVTKLTVDLDELKVSGSADEADAGSVEATAYLSYEDLSDALDVGISRGDGEDRVNVRSGLPLAGDVSVDARVSAATGNRIALKDVRVTEGVLSPAVRALPVPALEEPVLLRNIQEGLRLRSVTTTAEANRADFTGWAVTFRPDSRSA